MSLEFEEYLDKLPIHIIKLTEGTTLIAKFIEDDGEQTLLAHPMQMEVDLIDGKMELLMTEWLYGCNTEDVIINNENILTHAEANRKIKNFYSKCMIQERLNELMEELFEPKGLSKSEFISSIIDGLEPKDSTEDEDILGPWRDRFEWRPKSDTPTKEDDDLPF
jgi:hypothetical protein